MSTPRGLRNCNPLNIRRSADKWQGLSATQDDPAFFSFLGMCYGWRAAFVILTRSYYQKRGLNTIRKIISRWAPNNENNTEGYIKRVSQISRVAADDVLPDPKKSPSEWLRIGYAMAVVENGTTDFNVIDMLHGWSLL